MIEFDTFSHGVAVAAAAGCIFNPAVDTVIARTEGGVLRGGVIYQEYTGASIQAHIAGWGAGWLTKDLLWVIFDYPFVQLACKSIFLQIPTRNSKSLAFAKKLGFIEFVCIPEVFPDCDLSVMRMTRDECRFLDVACRAHQLMSIERSSSGWEK